MKWYNQFVWELCRHSVGEEIVVYPVLETLGDQGKQLAEEARAEHRKVKEMLSRMESLSSTGPKQEFDSMYATLMDDLLDHMTKKESVSITNFGPVSHGASCLKTLCASLLYFFHSDGASFWAACTNQLKN
jgi:iron-sulfur cluster repair protein YtfE (RIC family)